MEIKDKIRQRDFTDKENSAEYSVKNQDMFHNILSYLKTLNIQPSSLHLKALSMLKNLLKNNRKFPENSTTIKFRLKYFPGLSKGKWMDWKWQFQNRITTKDTLNRFIPLANDEKRFFSIKKTTLPLSITPYYLSLFCFKDFSDPVRKTVIPVAAEHSVTDIELTDPLGEDKDSPVPGIVHKYPDRVLFLATTHCSTYCRYCTRSRMVSKTLTKESMGDRWDKGIEYIKQTPEIRDVLVSGGDPLILSDGKIETLLTKLRAIEHVEIIRIGTKVPVVLPFRITHRLVEMLKKFHPLYINLHITHPDELTPETKEACTRLADAGIPLGSQTVLLKKINDSVNVMTGLFQKLLQIRVKPYYLFQSDLVPGTSHLRTPVKTGLEIIEGLRGYTSGLAIPHFAIDTPNGGGKIPLLPDYIEEKKQDGYVLRNYKNDICIYPDINL